MLLFAVPSIVVLLSIPVNVSASLLQPNQTRRLRSGTEQITQLRDCPAAANPFITKCTRNSKMDCYCIVSKRMEREGAEKLCQENGMYLVTLETETENNYVNNLAKENRDAIENQFWTSGFNSNLNPFNWVWDYSGLHPAKPFDYTNWCANEPNNFDRSENFVAVINGCWHDVPSGLRWPFICKFQANIFDPVLQDQQRYFTHLGERELVIPCRPSTAFYTGARVDISKYISDTEVSIQMVSNGTTANNDYEYDPLKGFIIRNVSSNDDGKYNCSITIDKGKVEAWMIFHIVNVGIQLKIDREFDPLEGNNVSLTCDPQQLIKRQPPFAPVKWFAVFTDNGDGNETALTPTAPVLPTGAWMEFVDETVSTLPQLKIFNVSTNLSGNYRCGFVFHSSNNSVQLTSNTLSLNVLKKIDWSNQLIGKQLAQVLSPASIKPDNYRVIPLGNDLRISCSFDTRGYLPYYQWHREQFEDDSGHNLRNKETPSRITMTKTINAEDGTDNLTIFVTNVTVEDQGLFTCLLNGVPPVSVSQYIYVDDRKSEDASITLKSTSSKEFFRVLGQQSIIPCRPVHPSIGMDILKLAKNGQSDEIILNSTSPDDNYGYNPQKGFIIHKVTVTDDGPYQCSPFGSVDPSIIFTITVVGVMVECVVGCESSPRRIDGFLTSEVDPAVESEKVELNCQGFRINDRPAVLDWFAIRNGVQVKIADSKSHPELKLGVTNTKNKIQMRKLTISNVKKMNTSTTYTCLMTAGKETYSDSIELKVLPKNQDKTIAIVTSVTVMLGVFSIAIAIALIYFYKNGERKFMRLEGLLQGDQSRLNRDLPLEEQADLLPYDKRWEFPRNRLRLGKQLGVGCFGRVLQAEAVGINDGSNRAVSTVAVKTTRSQRDATAIEGLISELKILLHLGSHVNILNLLGACTKAINRGEIFIIVEYCCFGNLRSYLINHREQFVSQVDESGELVTNDIEDCADDAITTSKLVCWAYQISRGMDYLVSKKVLHGDLATRNILLRENNVIKVADFGLSRCLYKDENYTKKSKSMLPLKWMALESLTDQVWSARSDVWSYGVVLWEIFSLGQTPYQGYSDEFQFLQALKSGYRMKKPERTPNCVASVMESCWNADPNLRPTFTQIEEILDAPLESFVKSFYLQLNEDYQRLNAERMTLDNFTVKPTEGYAVVPPLRPTSLANFYAVDPVDQSKNSVRLNLSTSGYTNQCVIDEEAELRRQKF
ncbi:fibroblast growth factor receptor 4-like isoform X2 [Daphnia carinata]|uniref:fibroblast growth factor receptor 4-like isoform X2 n=1 Tax=Daphnia carinata TaxID=120202 RepID=UPI0028683B53|nr:fibroblast growth factor receptor 4-like isoform X2 [Daphnia carinata]